LSYNGDAYSGKVDRFGIFIWRKRGEMAKIEQIGKNKIKMTDNGVRSLIFKIFSEIYLKKWNLDNVEKYSNKYLIIETIKVKKL